MVRPRVADHLQQHRFWLFDASPPTRAGWENARVLNPLAGFRTISLGGVQLETEPISQVNAMFPHHQTISATVDPVTLTRGVAFADDSFWAWFKLAMDGGPAEVRRDLLLLAYTGVRAEVGVDIPNLGPPAFAFGSLTLPGKAWMLWQCIPTAYRPADQFDATSGEVLIAELEVQPEYLEELTVP